MATTTFTTNNTQKVATVSGRRDGGYGYVCTLGGQNLGAGTASLFLSYDKGVNLLPITDASGTAVTLTAASPLATVGPIGSPTNNTDTLDIYVTLASSAAFPVLVHANDI